MAKIVLVEQDKVSIGMDDGAIKEVRTDDLNFVPHVGDEVEVFETESRTIISKKEQKKDAVPEGGIHINLSNAQNIGAGQVQYAPGKVVKKLVYCLLAFFLGWAGIHKFYAGRIGARYRLPAVLLDRNSGNYRFYRVYHRPVQKGGCSRKYCGLNKKSSPDGELFLCL